MVQVLGICSSNGGTLKTTLITNLAGIISKTKKVLIIDASAQGDCLLAFGKNPDTYDVTIYDLLINDRSVEQAIVNIHQNIDILPSNDGMNFFDFDVLSNLKKYPYPFHILKNAVQPVKENYDVVLVDTPINNGLAKGNVYAFVDKVLIPVIPDSSSVRSLDMTVKQIREFTKHQNPHLSIQGVVATLFNEQAAFHTEILMECKNYCKSKGITLFDTIIPQSVQPATAVHYDSLPLTLTKNKHLEAVYFYELLREIEAE